MSEAGGVGKAGPPPPGEKQHGCEKEKNTSDRGDQRPQTSGSLVNTDGLMRGPSRKSSMLALREPRQLPERKHSLLGPRNLSGKAPFVEIHKKDSLSVMREESLELELSVQHQNHPVKDMLSSDLEENTPRKLRRPAVLAIGSGNADFDFIDLDDIEALRNQNRQFMHLNSASNKRVLSELEELGNDIIELGLDGKSKLSSSNAQPDLLDLVSTHQDIELNCGFCEDYEIRIAGIESQLNALREVVRIAGSENFVIDEGSEDAEERLASRN
eukprot:IDg9393t1